MDTARDVQDARSGVDVALIRILVGADFFKALALFEPPLVRELAEEVLVDDAFQLVYIKAVKAVLQTIVLGLEPLYCSAVFDLLVLVALLQGAGEIDASLLTEIEPFQSLDEPLLQNLFPHILLRAFPAITRAMVVDVLPLLDFAHHGAAAMAAGDEPREREILLVAVEFSGVPAVKNALDMVPEVSWDEWRVFAPVDLPLPFEVTCVNPVSQNHLNAADRQPAL